LVGEHQTDKGKAGAMGDGGVYQRKVVLGVDASEHSERAFNCEYFHKIIGRCKVSGSLLL